MRNTSWFSAFVLLLGLAPMADAAADRLADIRSRGMLRCGIWPHVPGFATEIDGHYAGFEVDLCRAIAAAITGDATRVEFVTLEHVSQFFEHPDIDLAIRRLTWTLRRETASGLTFGPVVFYDGQGFMVPKGSGIERADQLAGERVCVINMERHPKTLHDYGHDIRLVVVDTDQEAERALRNNRCRAYSADVSWLAAARSGFSEGLTRYEILPDQISKEPLAPLMRAQDTELAQRVRWTVYAMIEAEEIGVSSHNVDAASPVHAVIAGVGNYGEVFERNLGASSHIQLDRGLNRLWNLGGLMYAPPLER